MNAIERLTNNSDRAKVNAYLDNIKEDDMAVRSEVLKQCTQDKEARAFYVAQFDKYLGIGNGKNY